MERIEKVWFSNERIYVQLTDGTTYNRPLEAFPVLKIASDTERESYEINKYGDAIRWKTLDEDIHVTGFIETKEPCYDNEVSAMFKRFPWLNTSEVARLMNIHYSVLLSYVYGMKEPTEERMKHLRDVLHYMGEQMCYA